MATNNLVDKAVDHAPLLLRPQLKACMDRDANTGRIGITIQEAFFLSDPFVVVGFLMLLFSVVIDVVMLFMVAGVILLELPNAAIVG